MKNWLKKHFGKYRGGADWITRSRVVFLSVLYPLIFHFGASLIAFWVGAVAQIIGMILDAVDGWWARNIQEGGPTADGQYLDQKYDKIFIWPSLIKITFARWIFGVGFRKEWAWLWTALVFNLLVLDVISFIMHRRDWIKDKEESVEAGEPVFDEEHGAWPTGKIKFVLMVTATCIEMSGLCPDVSSMSGWIWLATWLSIASLPILALANVSAFISVIGRKLHSSS